LRYLFRGLGSRIGGVNYFNLIVCSIFVIINSVACQPAPPAGETEARIQTELIISSSAFSEGQEIPVEYTCDGENSSVPLAWSGIPEGAQSLALITDDPDAPGRVYVHWVLYDLPADLSGLEEGVGEIGTPGENSSGNLSYNGPCPPAGPAHRYFFKLYALDMALNLQPGASKEQVQEAMQGHILAEGQLMGTYQR
jgi:Raf kinase inhibitor-like YbhB/YbcL family protein